MVLLEDDVVSPVETAPAVVAFDGGEEAVSLAGEPVEGGAVAFE